MRDARAIADARAALYDAFMDRRDVLRRMLLWAIVITCVALALAIAGELWVRHTIDVQLAVEQQAESTLQQQVEATRHAIQVATSPDAIEQQARSWGYARPGDQPIIIVTPVP